VENDDARAPRNSEHDHTLNDQIDSAVAVLREGGVVVLPTDTLYGLAASVFDGNAVERIYEIKGRPSGMALPLLLAERADFSRYATAVPEIAWRLIERFMPGPLTVVLEREPGVPGTVSGGLDTIALRMPDHWVPRAVARRLGAAITGTSANRTGSPGLTTADAVRRELGRDVDFIVDGGSLEGSIPSTVVDLTGPSPAIVRQGPVSRQAIEAVCGEQLVAVPTGGD